MKIADEMQKRIDDLGTGRSLLKECAEQKAQAIAEYDKELAKTMIKLKNGAKFDVDGVTIEHTSATGLEKVAKGVIWKKAMEKDLAEARYKNAIVWLDTVKAELNGYQSINRHLDET